MPSNVITALVLLILIYCIALVNVFAFNRETGLWTAGVGLVVLIFVFGSHACLNTGGCSLVSWVYVLIYMAILLALAFFTIFIFIDEYGLDLSFAKRDRNKTYPNDDQDENDETYQKEASRTYVNDDISLDSSGTAEDFIQRRQAQVRRMLKQMRSGE